jgi:hypothetical protein
MGLVSVDLYSIEHNRDVEPDNTSAGDTAPNRRFQYRFRTP